MDSASLIPNGTKDPKEVEIPSSPSHKDQDNHDSQSNTLSVNTSIPGENEQMEGLETLKTVEPQVQGSDLEPAGDSVSEHEKQANVDMGDEDKSKDQPSKDDTKPSEGVAELSEGNIKSSKEKEMLPQDNTESSKANEAPPQDNTEPSKENKELSTANNKPSADNNPPQENKESTTDNPDVLENTKEQPAENESNQPQDQTDKPSTPPIRYPHLLKVSQRTVAETLKLLTYKKLAACYPTIAATPAGSFALKQALTKIKRHFESSTLHEMDVIFRERELEKGLKGLETIINEAKERRERFEMASKGNNSPSLLPSTDNTTGQLPDTDKIPPSELPVRLETLTPNSIIRSHLLPLRKQRLDTLTARLSRLTTQNQELTASLEAKNQRATQLLQNIQKIQESGLKSQADAINKCFQKEGDTDGSADGYLENKQHVRKFLEMIIDQIDPPDLKNPVFMTNPWSLYILYYN